jgi:hypothetical protein
MVKKKNMIWVTFQKVGYHRYPAAGTDPKLEDVTYLANTHRHLFKFKVWIDVFNEDREIEFHQFLKFCETHICGNFDMDYKSCEMLSDALAGVIGAVYTGRHLYVEVSEDGECGSYAEYYLE